MKSQVARQAPCRDVTRSSKCDVRRILRNRFRRCRKGLWVRLRGCRIGTRPLRVRVDRVSHRIRVGRYWRLMWKWLVRNSWVGCRIGLGATVLRISSPVPRCAMTTHDPETGERDFDTLRAIKEYRGQVDGKDLMFGVWGEVETPGVIRLGDEVRVLA